MCCGTSYHPSSGHPARHFRGYHHAAVCACGVPVGPACRPVTKEEQAARLEQYLESLRQEAQAVEARITALKGEE